MSELQEIKSTIKELFHKVDNIKMFTEVKQYILAKDEINELKHLIDKLQDLINYK